MINQLVENLGLPKWIDTWRYTTFATVIVGAMVLAGCFWRPKGPSPSDPKVFVTREQLDAEVIAFKAKAEASYRSIELQEQVVSDVLAWANTLTAAVPGPWGGILTGALGIASAGLLIDNRRKDAVIQGTKLASRKR